MEGARIRVIHVIEAYSQGNYGIIESTLSTARILADRHGIDTELWFPKELGCSHEVDFRGATPVAFPRSTVFNPRRFAASRKLCPGDTVVTTHGCWRSATLVGARLKDAAFPWVYTPHGMLEPWSLLQKPWRKRVYWELREKRLAAKADAVRAVASAERDNLARFFSKVSLVGHGIESNGNGVPCPDSDRVKRVLFLGRLHPKKSAAALARAWTLSRLHRNPGFQLIVAGTDGGEEAEVNRIAKESNSNMVVKGPVFGTEKTELLTACSFFALPSHSEGFPMALLEGMAAGLIPLISDACNLPEAVADGLAFRVSPEVDDIVTGLNQLADLSDGDLQDRRNRVRQFIQDRYSLAAIAGQLAQLYRSLCLQSYPAAG